MRKNVLIIIVLIIFIIGVVRIITNPNLETICLPASSSGKETIVFNVVIHDSRLYPIMSEQKDGCLLLHDWYTKDSAKYRTKFQVFPFAQFVSDEYDHCCVNGK